MQTVPCTPLHTPICLYKSLFSQRDPCHTKQPAPSAGECHPCGMPSSSSRPACRRGAWAGAGRRRRHGRWGARARAVGRLVGLTVGTADGGVGQVGNRRSAVPGRQPRRPGKADLQPPLDQDQATAHFSRKKSQGNPKNQESAWSRFAASCSISAAIPMPRRAADPAVRKNGAGLPPLPAWKKASHCMRTDSQRGRTDGTVLQPAVAQGSWARTDWRGFTRGIVNGSGVLLCEHRPRPGLNGCSERGGCCNREWREWRAIATAFCNSSFTRNHESAWSKLAASCSISAGVPG